MYHGCDLAPLACVANPVAEANATVLSWLAQAGVSASLGPPRDSDDGRGSPEVRLWPLALLPDQALRTMGQPDSVRLRVRYLITSEGWGPGTDTPLDAVLDAVVGGTAVQLTLEPVAAETWRALGVRPRAAVQVDVPVHIARKLPAPPLVRGPLQLDGAPLVRLHGRVLGPGDVPVPGVRVRAPDVGASAETDRNGGFALAGVPAAVPTRLLITGKGLHLTAEVVATAQPVDLHCDFEEV
jgi:hypothetical protein